LLPPIPTLPSLLATSNTAILPIPTHSGQRSAAEVAKSWYGIRRSSLQPDAAFDFLAFAAGPQGAVAVAQAGYLPAAPTDAVAKVWADWKPPLPPTLQILSRTRWCADLNMGKEGELNRLAYGIFTQVLSGSMSVDDGVAAYSRQADVIRKR
jgi:ABC-type glycerol-3-phosphate transport system substrate-binding protein